MVLVHLSVTSQRLPSFWKHRWGALDCMLVFLLGFIRPETSQNDAIKHPMKHADGGRIESLVFTVVSLCLCLSVSLSLSQRETEPGLDGSLSLSPQLGRPGRSRSTSR